MFFTLFNMAGQQMQVVEYFSLSLDACRYHALSALLYPPAFRTVLTLILSLCLTSFFPKPLAKRKGSRYNGYIIIIL